MCGIVGLVERGGRLSEIRSEAYNEAINRLKHRGPDMDGEYRADSLWFGHTRLSILDLTDAAIQPMVTPDERFVITYNGEVYNFRDISDELLLDTLRTASDTEVILQAFSKIGVDVLQRLNGMFAFAIFDRVSSRLWLVRDRLGIKPLYYKINSHRIIFGSEIKALLSLDEDILDCDMSSLNEWLYYGNTLGKNTLYKGINRLLPGHYLEIDLKTFDYSITAYWSPQQQIKSTGITTRKNATTHKIRKLLEQAVKRQLVSDVPVGVFLSGGIDSSAITAFASQHYGGRLATYSVGFDFDKGVNELSKARKLAKRFCTEHHEFHISGYEIADVVEKMVDAHDMPFSDAANIPLYLMAAKIKGDVKVVLQGDGGDELFGGYRRYATLSKYRLLHPLANMGKHLNKLFPRTAHYHRRQRYLNALASKDLATTMALLLTEEYEGSHPAAIFTTDAQLEIEKSDPFKRYRECQNYFNNQDIVNQMALVDSMIILPDIFLEKVDRSTMAAGLEARVPFLDNDLVEYCMSIPGYEKLPRGEKKGLLKRALSGIVPDDVLYGPKTGFGVPYGYWLRESLKPLFFDHLEQFQRKSPSILNGDGIIKLYKEHESRERDSSFLLWKILNFVIWANKSNPQFRF